MTTETELCEKLATCTRILAMQELLGLFGHISVFDPASQRVYMSPSAGADKAEVQPGDIVIGNIDGSVLSGQRFALEWPIHMALHASRGDAIAVAHLHAPNAVLFSVSETPFRPLTLEGTVFSGSVPVYDEPRLVTRIEQGRNLAQAMGDARALLLRSHGIALAARSVEEMLYTALILEDEAGKQVRAASLGNWRSLDRTDAEAYDATVGFHARAARCWNYFCRLEHRWDHQPGTGCVPFI